MPQPGTSIRRQSSMRQIALADEVIDTIRIVSGSHPMDVLRTGVSALATFDEDVDNGSREAMERKSERLIAKAPTIVAAHERLRRGLEPVPPRDDLSHAAN